MFGYNVFAPESAMFQPSAPPASPAGLAGDTGCVGAIDGLCTGTSVYGAGGWNVVSGIVPRTIGIFPSKLRWTPTTSSSTYSKQKL